MRFPAALLAVLLACSTAHADCPSDGPIAEGSSARALSEVPYSAAEAEPCAKVGAPPSPTAVPPGAWDAPVGAAKEQVTHLGLFGVSFGSLLLVTGLQFAVCAHQGADTPGRDFCRAARAPTLIAGGTLAALGLGTLTIGYFMEEPPVGARSRGGGITVGLLSR